MITVILCKPIRRSYPTNLAIVVLEFIITLTCAYHPVLAWYHIFKVFVDIIVIIVFFLTEYCPSGECNYGGTVLLAAILAVGISFNALHWMGSILFTLHLGLQLFLSASILLGFTQLMIRYRVLDLTSSEYILGSLLLTAGGFELIYLLLKRALKAENAISSKSSLPETSR